MAMHMSSQKLDFFMECDVILDKLQNQKGERQKGGFPGIGKLIEQMKARKEKQDG